MCQHCTNPLTSLGLFDIHTEKFLRAFDELAYINTFYYFLKFSDEVFSNCLHHYCFKHNISADMFFVLSRVYVTYKLWKFLHTFCFHLFRLLNVNTTDSQDWVLRCYICSIIMRTSKIIICLHVEACCVKWWIHSVIAGVLF